MRKKYIKANNRKDSVFFKRLNQTPTNNFECFEDTARRRLKSKWDVEIEIKVEEHFRNGYYEPIYDLLLVKNGEVEKWSKQLGYIYKLDKDELCSSFQLHLYNMLDGIADKAYNQELSFMNNLYKQLECVAKDKLKYLNRNKRKWDTNCIGQEQLDKIPDIRQLDAYSNLELMLSLNMLPIEANRISEKDRQILIGLAMGDVYKKDIPAILNWVNKDDRKKLSRYCRKLRDYLIKHDLIYGCV